MAMVNMGLAMRSWRPGLGTGWGPGLGLTCYPGHYSQACPPPSSGGYEAPSSDPFIGGTRESDPRYAEPTTSTPSYEQAPAGACPGWSRYVPQNTTLLWKPQSYGGFCPYNIDRPAEIGTPDEGEFSPYVPPPTASAPSAQPTAPSAPSAPALPTAGPGGVTVVDGDFQVVEQPYTLPAGGSGAAGGTIYPAGQAGQAGQAEASGSGGWVGTSEDGGMTVAGIPVLWLALGAGALFLITQEKKGRF